MQLLLCTVIYILKSADYYWVIPKTKKLGVIGEDGIQKTMQRSALIEIESKQSGIYITHRNEKLAAW